MTGEGSDNEKNPIGGFTLIELLVVVSIISLLVSITVPALSQARNAAKALVCLTNQRALGTACFFYSEDNGTLPSSDTFCESVAQNLDRNVPENIYDWTREKMPKVLFCPCDEDPYPRPYMAGAFEVTSYFVNGAERDYAMGGGRSIRLGLFGGDGRLCDIGAPAECMLIGETTNYDKIADCDHPAAIAAFAAAGTTADVSRRRFHHRATSGFFHDRRMNVYFADGHGEPVAGRKMEPLPVNQWPSGAIMDPTTAFYPALSLPTATENPKFWGPPYDGWQSGLE